MAIPDVVLIFTAAHIPDVVLIFTVAHIPDVVLCSLSLEWRPFINTCEVLPL